MKHAAVSVLIVATGLLPAAGVQAQKYPERPIRLIVPFSPGGTSDLLGRVVGQRLGDGLGTTVVIDNRGGAGGTLGAGLGAKAVPDGYTLLVSHVGLAVNETLYSKKSYNALKDLAPISRIGETPGAVVVANALPAKNMQELIALAKKQPGKLNASSAGIGSAAHLALALLENTSGAHFNHVPFKGGGPSMIAVVAGQVDLSIPAYPTAVPHIKAGKLRILAVTGATREPTVPNVPTVAESGVPGYDFTIWFALYAPSGTPQAIISRINKEIVAGMAERDMREKLARAGVNAGSSTPEALGEYLRAEVAKWAKVVKAAGIPIN